MITKEEFDEICLLVCPHCRRGVPVRFREETKEYVHDWVANTEQPMTKQYGHAICWSNGLRGSKYAPKSDQ